MTQSCRFPYSAQLFRLCFRILSHNNPQACEQQLGEILELTSSDTSHWKRGKRPIRTMEHIQQLARALSCDIYLLKAVAEGSLDWECAWLEFQDVQVERHLYTALEQEGASLLRAARQLQWDHVAQAIHHQANIGAYPVHLAELFACFPNIQISQGEMVDKLARGIRIKPGHYALKHRKLTHPTASAHIRLAAARELAKLLLQFERHQLSGPMPEAGAKESWTEADVRDFSAALLVPFSALCTEIQKVSVHTELVETLARSFWVPRSLMCTRLQCVLSYKEPFPYGVQHTNSLASCLLPAAHELPQNLLLGR